MAIQTTPSLASSVTDSTGYFDVQKLMNATLSGQDPEQAAYGKSVGISDTPLVDENEDQSGNDSADTEQAASSDNEQDTSASDPNSGDAESNTEEPANLTANSANPDIETVALKIKDPKTGRSQRIEINYADRTAIKKAFIEAAGMRKFQTERDNARKQITDIQSKYDELNGVYSQLDEAFQKGGVKGLYKLLDKDPKAWDTAIKAELEHQEYLSNLTPSEKYRYEAEQKQKEYESKLAEAETRNQTFMKQVQEREESASRQSLEARLHPAFDRYRFTGKLGDPVVEHQFDEAIWNKVMTRLSEYPDSVELTQALVDKEFREVSNNFKKMVTMQTEKAVKATIEKKKADASEKVQAIAKKGLSGNNSDHKQFMENMKSGNLQDAFKAMFTGKVKL